jgi:hypothetical protein
MLSMELEIICALRLSRLMLTFLSFRRRLQPEARYFDIRSGWCDDGQCDCVMKRRKIINPASYFSVNISTVLQCQVQTECLLIREYKSQYKLKPNLVKPKNGRTILQTVTWSFSTMLNVKRVKCKGGSSWRIQGVWTPPFILCFLNVLNTFYDVTPRPLNVIILICNTNRIV